MLALVYSSLDGTSRTVGTIAEDPISASLAPENRVYPSQSWALGLMRLSNPRANFRGAGGFSGRDKQFLGL